MKERIHKKQRVIQQITRQQLYSSIITKQYALKNRTKQISTQQLFLQQTLKSYNIVDKSKSRKEFT